jgi:hypothetical protein
VLLEEEDAALDFIEGEDKATITTLQVRAWCVAGQAEEA